MPATSQLDLLISMTAMIVLFWSRATRDLLKSFGWGIAALHRLHAATKLPFPRRPPHSVSWSHPMGVGLFAAANQTEITRIPPFGPKPRSVGVPVLYGVRTGPPGPEPGAPTEFAPDEFAGYAQTGRESASAATTATPFKRCCRA